MSKDIKIITNNYGPRPDSFDICQKEDQHREAGL